MIPIKNQNAANQNAFEFMLFLLISIVAFNFRDFNLFMSSSESMKMILGTPPPANLINIALAVYLFSAAVIRLISISAKIKPIIKYSHLGYRSIFYVFFCFSGAIQSNFTQVLLVGIFMFILDELNIILYYKEHQGVPHES